MATKRTVAAAEPLLILQPHRVGAAVAQLGSLCTTWLFIQALGITGFTGLFVAMSVEFLLLIGKTLVLVPGENADDMLGWVSIVLDTLLNAGGLWPYVQRLDQTPVYRMWADVTGLQADLRLLPAAVLVLVLGYLLSIAPHRLWRA